MSVPATRAELLAALAQLDHQDVVAAAARQVAPAAIATAAVAPAATATAAAAPATQINIASLTMITNNNNQVTNNTLRQKRVRPRASQENPLVCAAVHDHLEVEDHADYRRSLTPAHAKHVGAKQRALPADRPRLNITQTYTKNGVQCHAHQSTSEQAERVFSASHFEFSCVCLSFFCRKQCMMCCMHKCSKIGRGCARRLGNHSWRRRSRSSWATTFGAFSVACSSTARTLLDCLKSRRRPASRSAKKRSEAKPLQQQSITKARTIIFSLSSLICFFDLFIVQKRKNRQTCLLVPTNAEALNVKFDKVLMDESVEGQDPIPLVDPALKIAALLAPDADTAFMSTDEDEAEGANPKKQRLQQRLVVPWRSDACTTLLHHLDSMDPSFKPPTVLTTRDGAQPSKIKIQALLHEKYRWAIRSDARQQWLNDHEQVSPARWEIEVGDSMEECALTLLLSSC